MVVYSLKAQGLLGAYYNMSRHDMARHEQRKNTAETLDDPYYHIVPLPRFPVYHKLDKQARLAGMHDRHASTTYAHAASNTRHARFTSVLRSISKMGPANYYARLQALHNPNR